MTLYSFWQQSLTYPALHVRKLMELLAPGVADGVYVDRTSPLLVQAQATPNMTVRVQPGWGRKSGYLGYSDAVTNVTIATANASNPRIDLIVMRWKDTEAGDPSSAMTLEVIQGTPAATPTAPSTAGTVVQVLAQVAVAAGTTTIAASAVTDTRTLVYLPAASDDRGASGSIRTGSVLLQWGQTTVSISASAAGTAAVTFPLAYSVTPRVFPALDGSSTYIPSTAARSTTGFTAVARQMDNTSATASVTYQWFAVGVA